MPGVSFTFRRLTDDDLPTMHRWLNEPGIVQWWEGDDVSWDGIVADYGSGREPDGVEHWIAECDGADVGWISCYAASDWPDQMAQWRAVGGVDTAAGIDYFVADPARRGAGVGSRMIAAFVDQVVFGLHPTWTQACADPDIGNIASWRALEKAGFRELGEVAGRAGDAGPVGPWRLMALDRPEGR